MPLPHIGLPADEFADELAYCQAQLAADDKVKQFAPEVEEQVKAIDDRERAVRIAERQEIMARAKRDRADRDGDELTQAFRRELAGMTNPKHQTLTTVFPDSIRYEISATGETQAQRTQALLARVGVAEQAEALKRDPNET